MLLVQIVGYGYDKEMFYTDSRVKQAYRNYVYMLLNRINTYTGVQYKNDATIFSFELMVRPGRDHPEMSESGVGHACTPRPCLQLQ